MTRILSLLAVLLLSAQALAAKVPASSVFSSVCTISVRFTNGERCGGSGTLVGVSKDGHGLIISARHVYADGKPAGITCTFPVDGKPLKAKLLGTARPSDIAALDVESPPAVTLPKAIVPARKEDSPFTCCGFPSYSRDDLRWTQGKFAGYRDIGNENHMLVTHQKVYSGYSGGGRFNRWGEYVGPISGMIGEDDGHMDYTYGASGDELLKFVGKFMKVQK